MIKIGPIELDSPVLLAPMSGITDLPFRRLVSQFGVGLIVSEMVASRELLRQTKASMRRARLDQASAPGAVQLAGVDPAIMADAARFAAGLGARIIDINFGCPARKVVGKQAGSALMRDERLATAIVAAVVGAVDVPVTVKMRMGWDHSTLNAPQLARRFEGEGAQMIAVHGRTRCQRFAGHADWSFIRRVKEAVGVPVIANGDIDSVPAAQRCLRESGADGLMVGRASQGRPWFPGQLARFLLVGQRPADPSVGERCQTLRRHLHDMMSHYGTDVGLRVARKHVGWYASGLPGAASFRQTVNNTMDPHRVLEALNVFYGEAGYGETARPAAA